MCVFISVKGTECIYTLFRYSFVKESERHVSVPSTSQLFPAAASDTKQTLFT